MVFVPLTVSGESLDTSYEEPWCFSADEPDGDIRLVCNESPTIARMTVTAIDELLDNGEYSAKTYIHNKNRYTVRVRTIVVTARNSEGDPVGFCGADVDLKLMPGDKVSTRIRCTIQPLGGSENIAVSWLEVRASPW